MSLARAGTRIVGWLCTWVLLALWPLAASAQGITDLFMSPQQEKRVGAEEHQRILEEFGGAYDDAALSAYVSSIGSFLALTSKASATQFTFTVLDSPVVNAFALPGGYVYVTRGLLALAGSEAELAGVLAHEIGHVAARHGARRQANSTLATLGLLVLGVATKSSAAVNLGQLGAAAVLSGYSREDEYEADSLGVQYLSRAGFAPQAMSSFLARLQAHHQLEARIAERPTGEGFDFFATHPRTPDRVARAVRAAASTTVHDPIVARDIYLAKIDGIVYGDDPAQGLVRGRRFVHPRLGFEFTVPSGFHLLNGRSSVIAQGPDGAGIKFDLDNRATRGSMTGYIRQVWAPRTRITHLEPIRINGIPAATGVVEGVQNGRADVRLLAIAFNTRTVYRFIFVSPVQEAARLDLEYRRTAYSFRRLRQREAEQLHPYRVEVHSVVAGERAEALAGGMPFARYNLERFAVLNGLQAGAALVPGQRVKLIVE